MKFNWQKNKMGSNKWKIKYHLLHKIVRNVNNKKIILFFLGGFDKPGDTHMSGGALTG